MGQHLRYLTGATAEAALTIIVLAGGLANFWGCYQSYAQTFAWLAQ